MSFCINCGSQLVSGAKFCQKCGFPIKKAEDKNNNQRSEFAGKLYKCPNCGETIDSFEAVCPACGYELRDTSASSAVREFARKLEAIEATRKDEETRRFLGSASANDRISKTDNQKINLIKSFSIPNTKEDLLEFMILATSNVNYKSYNSTGSTAKGEQALNDAWVSKIRQSYEKAKLLSLDIEEFNQIERLYADYQKNIRKAKTVRILKYSWIPILVALIILEFVWIIKSSEKDEAQHIADLSAVVSEVKTAIDNKEYKHALRLADSIDYRGYDTEQERKWDIEREYWTDKVIEEAAKSGVELEYTPTEDIDNANKETKPEETSEEEQRGIIEGFKEGFYSAFEDDKDE